MKIHVINVMWGKEYVDLFLKTTLPSQLSKKNLGKVNVQHDIIYKIYTTPDFREYIEKDSLYLRLSRFVHTEIHTPTLTHHSNKYLTMTAYHQLAIQAAQSECIPMIFIAPDAIFSEGSFDRIISLIEKGKRVIYIPTIRLSKQSFPEAIHRKLMELYQKGTTFEPRDLVNEALPHLHPITKSLLLTGKKISKYPSHLSWYLDEHSILIRGFHLSPILIWPEKTIPLTSTTDGAYLSQACPTAEKQTVITDSDDFAIFEISDPILPKGMRPEKYFLWRIVKWTQFHTTSAHLNLLKHKCYLRGGERTDIWETIEDHSDYVVEMILNQIAKNSLFSRCIYFLEKAKNKLKYEIKKTMGMNQ